MGDNLMEVMAMPENLLSAWHAVRGNVPKYRRASSAGPDGVSLVGFERDLSAQLDTLRDMLLHGRYEPTPPKMVNIPKSNGKERTIGILNVRDRVAQRAAVQVLSPLWEPDFLDCSFGFRPGRGTPDALAYVQSLRASGCQWVVEGDIQDCFGSLEHDQMLRRVERRVEDRRVTALVARWLDVGALSAGLPGEAQEAETPENGGGLSRSWQHGLNWVIEMAFPGAVSGPEEKPPMQRPPAYWLPEGQKPGEADADADQPEPAVNYEALAQTEAMRRMAFTALAAGATWLRPNIGQALYRVGQVVNTPAGRRMLRSGSWVVAGLAGAAAVGAVTAMVINRYAGPAPAGIVQGSPLSPLLANVYLHPFDLWLTRHGHRLVRYADDFVVLAEDQSHAEAGYNESMRALRKLRLKANRQKMRIVRPGEPWEFLGTQF